jgi:hypothetical protein
MPCIFLSPLHYSVCRESPCHVLNSHKSVLHAIESSKNGAHEDSTDIFNTTIKEKKSGMTEAGITF